MKMTPAESHYVLQSLLSEGRIRLNQVKAVLNGRSRVIAELRERLAIIDATETAIRAGPEAIDALPTAQLRRTFDEVAT